MYFPKIKCGHVRRKREELSASLLNDFDLEDFLDCGSPQRASEYKWTAMIREL